MLANNGTNFMADHKETQQLLKQIGRRVCVDKLVENSLLRLVFAFLPKYNKNSVFLHILVNVASID